MSLYSIFILKVVCGNPLDIQWLGLHPYMARGKGFNPDWGMVKKTKNKHKN